MNKAVLDSSVLLAILFEEPYDGAVWPVLEGAILSAVSLTEVLSRLADGNLISSPSVGPLFALVGTIAPFTEEQARVAAHLRESTRKAGLSLGDRACIALALELDADVYTTDRAWAQIDLPCRIHLIR